MLDKSDVNDVGLSGIRLEKSPVAVVAVFAVTGAAVLEAVPVLVGMLILSTLAEDVPDETSQGFLLGTDIK